MGQKGFGLLLLLLSQMFAEQQKQKLHETFLSLTRDCKYIYSFCLRVVHILLAAAGFGWLT